MKRVLTILFLAVFIVSVGLNCWFMVKSSQEIKDTVRIEKIDTIRDTIFDTIPQLKNIKQLKVIKDTLVTKDTIKVEVEIPFEQKTFVGKQYSAYVSGYKPNLDSIRIYNTTVEKTVTKTVTKRNRWSVGPTITTGYDIYNRNFGITVGIGITYNILK